MDALSDSIQGLNGRRMLAEIERLEADNERLRAHLFQWSANDMTALQLLEENERLKASLVEHFQRDHIDGDGPEIDRWKARIKAALALHHELQGYCRTCGGDWPCTTVRALRGEK